MEIKAGYKQTEVGIIPAEWNIQPLSEISTMHGRIGWQGLKKSELTFTRPAKGYPRFHLYLKVEAKNLILNLHLDQKRPSYKGSPAHAGEHKGKVVEEEAERIKEILQK